MKKKSFKGNFFYSDFLSDVDILEGEEKESGPNLNENYCIKGKFIFKGNQKLYIRGVTYGAFRPDANGKEYQNFEKISSDFSMMSKNGINAVRIPHTTPPKILLDIAHQHNLVVMIGLSAEQYIGYLIDRKKAPDIRKIIKDKLKECIGHPALLCIAIGNEIPSSMVRWIGRRKIENYLWNVYKWVKEEVPETIVTYVNYPSTEYLDLSFLDLICFNVYLESQVALEAYLARLHNLSGNRPLLLGEVGLDSLRNGLDKQSDVLEWQIASTFKMGCSGLFVFSWTDEWFRGGEEVYDWSFGLTTKEREPKPALISVSRAFKKVPFDKIIEWPKISIIICIYNGENTLNECLQKVCLLNYPDYEVIVVNDGSTDNTEEIASFYDVRVISTKNQGLSIARNVGAIAAEGDIISYLDCDAYPDQDWLYYIADSFLTTDAKAIGGPNIIPEKGNFISSCVDLSPGSPTHVLTSDTIAEHIPGCNMSFMKEYLLEVGGFDPLFRVAGDDVDICWRFEEKGWKIGFNPAAFVWHHRRNSITGYLKQQMGYGKAEALLEKKWPEKYNDLGHRTWGGRLYSNDVLGKPIFEKIKVFHGVWGTAPFQSLYGKSAIGFLSNTFMPEWLILCSFLILLGIFGIKWSPLLIFIPLSIIAVAIPLVHIIYSISKNLNRKKHTFSGKSFPKLKLILVSTFLHMIQPLARLMGRFQFNLTPWRRKVKGAFSLPVRKKLSIWCESWMNRDKRLELMESELKSKGTQVIRGGDFDLWDIRVQAGTFGGVKITMAAEDHAKRKQMLRFRITPYLSLLIKYVILFLMTIAIASALDRAWVFFGIFSSILLITILRSLLDLGTSFGIVIKTIKFQENLSEM